jgi:hypothetical protein
MKFLIAFFLLFSTSALAGGRLNVKDFKKPEELVRFVNQFNLEVIDIQFIKNHARRISRLYYRESFDRRDDRRRDDDRRDDDRRDRY